MAAEECEEISPDVEKMKGKSEYVYILRTMRAVLCLLFLVSHDTNCNKWLSYG